MRPLWAGFDGAKVSPIELLGTLGGAPAARPETARQENRDE